MAERTGSDALTLARELLVRLTPATARVRAVEPAIAHEWCFVVYWTLADSNDSPPPGAGPIAVPKAGGAAFYLGSHDLSYELELARAQTRSSCVTGHQGDAGRGRHPVAYGERPGF